MSPESQRIAIAEACGWQHRLATVENPVERGGMRLPNSFGPSVEAWWHDGRSPIDGCALHLGVYGEPPRYLSDLNAMHEAEKTLNTTGVWMDYVRDLGRVFLRKNGTSVWEIHCHKDEMSVAYSLINFVAATPQERAEAFLRTIDKWDDSK